MKCRFVLAALAVVGLAACSEKIENGQEFPEKKVNVGLSVSCDMDTKVSGVSGETKVNDLQVFVFGSNNRLEAYKHEKGKSSLVLGLFPGQKKLHVLVNAPKVSNIVDYEDLYTKVSELKDNSADNFVMEGYKSLKVGNEDFSTDLQASRLVSKVSLVKIENKLDDIYGNLEFTVSRAYLTNVAGDRGYSAEGHPAAAPSLWFHKMKYVSSDGISDLTMADYKDEKIMKSKSYTTAQHFYCYPNPTEQDSVNEKWSIRFTKLVVEIKLGGELYYYPLPLGKLEQNTAYQVSLAVTHPGSNDPDTPYNQDSGTFDIKVVDWNTGKPIDETI